MSAHRRNSPCVTLSALKSRRSLVGESVFDFETPKEEWAETMPANTIDPLCGRWISGAEGHSPNWPESTPVSACMDHVRSQMKVVKPKAKNELHGNQFQW